MRKCISLCFLERYLTWVQNTQGLVCGGLVQWVGRYDDWSQVYINVGHTGLPGLCGLIVVL